MITSGPRWAGDTSGDDCHHALRAALDKYEELVKKHYQEPKDGKFKDPFSHFRSGRGWREI